MISYLEIFEKMAMFERVRIATDRTEQHVSRNAEAGSFERLLSDSLLSSDNRVAQRNNEKADYVGPNEDEKFKKCLSFVLEKEGAKLVKEDGAARESSKMGILQSTARAFGYKGNIINLNTAEAEKIYRRVWEQSGASALPFPLALVHFDSYVNNPASSVKFLEKSHGDVTTYLKLREQRYVRLASAKPETFGKYLGGWKNRIKSLQVLVASQTKQNDLLRTS
jgi:hypothetical protein